MMTLHLDHAGRIVCVETAPDPDGWCDVFARAPNIPMADDDMLDFGGGRRMTVGEWRRTQQWDDEVAP